MSILEISGLEKSFKGKKVLDGLSLDVPENSIYGFVGANGAGKTTTMRIVLGLLRADAGQVRVCGERVTFGSTPTNRFIGYLPDVPKFYAYMRPRDYLALCADIVGLKGKELAYIDELIGLVGLKNANKKIASFSRGMKQRLGVAQALLGRPRLLICDEPTSALDPIGRREILDLLKRIKDRTTVMFSTHIISDVERICDRVAVLSGGRIALESSLADLKLKEKSTSLSLKFEREVEVKAILKALEAKGLRPLSYEAGERSIESLLLELVK